MTATKFKVDDHVRTRPFPAGLHDLSFEPEREPYLGLVAVVTAIYNPLVLKLRFADGAYWLWPVEACVFQWSLTMQHQFVTGDVVRALPHDENKNDLLEIARPYFGQQAVVLTAGERFLELAFEDGQHRGWPVSACEFKYRPWTGSPSTTIDPGRCTHNHGGPCPNCPRFNVIAESQIAAGNLTYVCACGAKLLWDPHSGRWLRFKEFQYGDPCEMRLLPPTAPVEREYFQLGDGFHFSKKQRSAELLSAAQMEEILKTYRDNALAAKDMILPPDVLERVNSSMAAVQTAFEVFANTIQAVVASLQPVLQKIMNLRAPYNGWHACVIEGGLAQCPCCEQLIPASLVPAIKDQKARCPLCNHTGSQPVCPVCRGLLISSHAFFNVRERWHCQDCGRQFDDDQHEL